MKAKTKQIGKNKFRTSLSFTKAEIQRAQLQMRGAGIELPMQALSSFKNRDKMGFGWLASGNNANTFYPGLNVAEELMPKPEDFVDAPFRLISATVVGAHSWKATDFSDESVLRASVEKLSRKAVYYDHDTDTLNWVGVVKSPQWSTAYTAKDGTKVPAGIDGIISIDAKSNPKLARGVLVGALYSNSVTVEFDWIPSHTFESGYEFDNRLGTIGPDGKMVRRVVTEIRDYHESSLVWLGADPYAKAIDADGELVNIDKASTVADSLMEKEKESYSKNGKFSVSLCYNRKSNLSLIREGEETPENETSNKTKMNKFLVALIAAFGVSFGVSKQEDLTEDMVAKLEIKDPEKDKKLGWFAKLNDAIRKFLKTPDTDAVDFDKFLSEHNFVAATKLVEFEKQAATIQKLAEVSGWKADDKVTLEDFVASLAKEAKLGRDHLNFQRTEAARLYKLAMGDKADNAVVALIEKADADAIPGLLAQYTKGATERFSGQCKKCGSNEFEFRSSIVTEEEQGRSVTANSGVSIQDIHSKFDQQRMNIGGQSRNK